mmetsp:Transcript_28203/g.48326  ORF Transcript_28203/g.48326 Transcript_28203/m.48326 type:complete len:630 (+) Transcript_28203:255-2144(+)
MQGVWLLGARVVRRHCLRAIHGLHAQEVDDCSHGLLLLLELQCELLQHFAVSAHGVPVATEIPERHFGHEVVGGQLQVLQGEVLVEASGTAVHLAGHRVHLQHLETQLARQRDRAVVTLGAALQGHETSSRLAVTGNRRGHDSLHSVGIGVTHLHVHLHVAQLLVVNGVQHVELQHHVISEDVLHAGHHVLHLGLREGSLSSRAEGAAQLGKLGQGIHSGSRVRSLDLVLVTSLRGGGVGSGAGPLLRAGTHVRGGNRHVSFLDDGQGGEGQRGRSAGVVRGVRHVSPHGAFKSGEGEWHGLVNHELQLGVVHEGAEGLLQDGRAVAHLVVLIGQRALQKSDDGGAQLRHAGGEGAQSRHSGGTHRGVLQDHAVEHIADVARRGLGVGSHGAEDVKSLDDELTELTIFDELAQMQQGSLLGLGDGPHQIHDAVHDGLLELIASLLAQESRHEADHDAVLLGVLEAQLADGLHHDNLEFVADLVHEGGDLLHQTVHTVLSAGLQQRGDGESRDGSVGVRDQQLHVIVALGRAQGMQHGHLAQRAHGSEAQGGLGRGQEQLQHRDRGVEIVALDAWQVAHSLGCLVDHHFALVAQAVLQELIGCFGVGGGHVLMEQLTRVADKQTGCQRRA